MKRKKGFTIVELVIVIAIVAILAAVLIPVLSSVIAKANLSSDIQLVKNLNTFLNIDLDEDFNLKTNNTMYDALEAAKANGISVDNIKNNKAHNHRIIWNSQSDRFVLVNESDGSCVYFAPNTNQEAVISDENKHLYFAIYDEMPTEQTYSIYATDSLTGDNGEVNLTVGFDQGSNVRINSLIYDRSTADSSRQVIIRTNNGTTCEFNGYEGVGGSDTIYHYGESGNQTISVGQHSFCEYGAATEVEVKKGHYVQETGSIVAIVNAKADYGDVIIDFKTGSIQGTVKNTNETNNVVINYDSNVMTVNFEGKIDGGSLNVSFSSQPSYVNVGNMFQEKDSDKPEVRISGLNITTNNIPSYDDVGEENAECISVAGYSVKVYTNCNAYSYSETMVDENIVKENTYTIKFDGNGDSITFNSSDDHIHTFGGPSWTWDGYTTSTAAFVCTADDCNYIEKIVIPTKGGYITNEITKNPTCCETGEKTYTAHLTHHNVQFANVSPNKEIIDIDVNAHSWGNWSVTTIPTCELKGVETRICNHNQSHTETREIDVLGHNLVHHESKAATCTEIGWNAYDTCSRCNYTTYVEIPALGHNYVSEVTNPTCTEQGYTTHTCSRCGDSYVGTYVNALGHNFVNGICTGCGESNISIKFENTDKYLYRVGNNNSVAASSLFEGDISNIGITNIQGNAGGSYTNGNINFTGTGVVKITANGSVELLLEVVDGYNVTTYSELQNRNSVLLNDITMSNGGKYYLLNATLYGNGFTFDVKNAAYAGTGSESNNYVIGLNNSILDNVQIIGKVYTDYGGTTSADWNYPCVLVNGGNCVIANSYIANCASPIRARGGANLILKNTTLKGGSFCNLDIRSGVKLTIDGLTTINQVEGNDKADNGTTIIGLGIIVYYEGSNGSERITIQGNGLTQYNYVANNQSDNAVSSAKTVFSAVFNINSNFVKTVNNVKWVNTGILSLTSNIGSDSITNPNGYDWQDVSMLGQSGHLCTQLATNFPASLPVTPQNYSSYQQYMIAPSYSFEYPTSAGKTNYLAKTDGSNDYCYWDSTTSSILIGFDEGKDFTFDPDILTITKNNHSIIPIVSFDGGTYHEVSFSILINSADEHTLTFKYIDPYNYDKDGNRSYDVEYTKIVNIVATEAKANIQAASFDFGGNGYKSITANNTTYIMPDVSSTNTTSIGSKTISGKTVYYPIVFVKYATFKNENPNYTTDIDTNVGKSAYTQAYCPIFDGVITIIDYDANNNAITYGSSTTTMADGKLTYVESDVKTALTWSSADIPSTSPVVKSSKLYFQSVTIQGVNRNQTMSIIEYIYTDNSGNAYHYFVKYVFPSKGQGVKMLGHENEKYTITINVEGGNGTVNKNSITNVSRGSNINSSGNELKNGNKTIATATPDSGYNTTWSGVPSKFLEGDITITVSFSTSSSSSCVTPGTMITLANGMQKPVEMLTGEEMLLVWNLETGKFDSAPIMFIDCDPTAEYKVIHLYFSDNTEVKVISEHGFWNYDLNKYIYLDENASDYIGHSFAKQNDKELNVVKLVDAVIEYETTTAWSPVTVGHLCYFVNGMLSMPGGIDGLFNIFDVDDDTMAYDIEKMQSDIETYGLLTIDDFDGLITEEMFEAFNGKYLGIAVGKENLTWEFIVYLAERYAPLCN